MPPTVLRWNEPLWNVPCYACLGIVRHIACHPTEPISGYSPQTSKMGSKSGPKSVDFGVPNPKFGVWGLEMGPKWDPSGALYWTHLRGSPPRRSLDLRAGTWPLDGALSPGGQRRRLATGSEVART